jgi:lysophospholipase L1-like esterase
MMGDSLMDSTAGFTVHPELALPQNQCWAQPVASKPTPYTATPDFTGFWNRSAYTTDATRPRARICWKFANRGWRLATLPGGTYPSSTGAWANQQAYLQCIPVAADQQLVFIIQAGTNDQHEAHSVLLYGRPEFGRPNMIENCLAPLVAMIRGLYPAARFPDVKIGVMTPIARWWAPNTRAANGQLMNDWANAQFSAYANWLTILGNPQSIGIDAVWDSRRDRALDCRRAATVTLDTTVYQRDRTHLMANGYVHHLGPGATALLDKFWA